VKAIKISVETDIWGTQSRWCGCAFALLVASEISCKKQCVDVSKQSCRSETLAHDACVKPSLEICRTYYQQHL